jgi:hypothetical protein
MSKSVTLSPQLIASKQNEAIKSQTLNKRVNLGAITIIDENHIKINGIKIKMRERAFYDLIKCMGLPKSFTDELQTLFNKASKVAFINRLSQAIVSLGKTKSINAIVSPSSKTIVGFTHHSNLISNETFFELADKITEGQGLGVTNIYSDSFNGSAIMNLKLDKQTEIKGLSNEAFKPGLTLTNIPGAGIQVAPFMERLWCANGCTTGMVRESYQLEDLTTDGMNRFFDHIKSLRESNFVPTGYGDMVRGANATPASIRELDRAYNLIKGATSEDIADRLTQRSRNYNAYSEKGLDFTGNKENAESNQSVWSLVNAITYVGSNSNNLGLEAEIEDSVKGELQVSAGNILTKNYDLKPSIASPFRGGLNPDLQIGALLN